MYEMKGIRSLIRKFYNRLCGVKTWIMANMPYGSKCFLIETPSHRNIGDNAIVIAEKKIIATCLPKVNRIKEVTDQECYQLENFIDKFLSPHSTCLWHGGGNMGDQWFYHEALRRRFIHNQMNRNHIIFPQTIYYTQTDIGRKKQQESIPIYNHPNIKLVAREQKSYEIMQELYPKAKRLLTPDIVLYTTMADYGVQVQERTNILWVMRSDAERNMTDRMRADIAAAIKKYGFPVVETNMFSDCPVNKRNRMECVRKKMQQFCSAKLVITDRLHGMIFAAITETPCIVFSNYNHKVKGTYDWISYLPYIKYVNSVEEALAFIPKLLAMKDCKFDNAPLLPYFDKLKIWITEK